MKSTHQHSRLVQPARLLLQLSFLALASFAAWRHQTLGGGPEGAASIDALCPFGGLEALFRFAMTGEYIQRLNSSDFVLLGGTILLALTVGRYFCGWLCPLGTMQELARKLGRRLFGKREFAVPPALDKPLRWMKYVVLVWALVFTWKTGSLIIRPYDPWAAYAHGFAGWGEMWSEFAVGSVILLAMLTGGLFIDRLFCKYLCPLGAFLGLTTKLGFFSIRRNKDACLACTKCEQACPVNIPVMQQAVIRSSECIGCLSCTTACPTGKRNTPDEGKTFLLPAVAGRTLRPALIGAAGLVLFAGSIGLAQLGGVWRTLPPSLNAVASINGQLDPQAIRGFMSLADIATTYGLELDALYRELDLSEARVPASTKAKDVRTLAGLSEEAFDTQTIRDAVARLRTKP